MGLVSVEVTTEDLGEGMCPNACIFWGSQLEKRRRLLKIETSKDHLMLIFAPKTKKKYLYLALSSNKLNATLGILQVYNIQLITTTKHLFGGRLGMWCITKYLIYFM